eukprot:1161964-Pelagomonas_calceolata.AAC.3
MKDVMSSRDSCPPPPATLFSTPRTLTFLTVVLVLIGYHANVLSGASAHERAEEHSREQNTKAGVVAVAAVFLGIDEHHRVKVKLKCIPCLIPLFVVLSVSLLRCQASCLLGNSLPGLQDPQTGILALMRFHF